MGFSIAWVAVSGRDKAGVLDRLSLVDTGVDDEANESAISGAQLPGGWYLLFLNDHADPILSDESLRALSSEGVAVACQVEEHVMVSAACCFRLGKRAWSLEHDGQRGIFDLDAAGDPPPDFPALRDRLLARLRDEGGDAADIDHVFDLPVALAESMCGYRHDRVELQSGERPPFTRLAMASARATTVGEPVRSIHVRADGPTRSAPTESSLPRWVQVPAGLLLALFLLPCTAGSLMLALLPNEASPVAAPIGGALMTLACLWLFTLCWRLVSGRRSHGGLMGPRALRLVSWIFLLLPVGGLLGGYFASHTLHAVAQTVIYVGVFFSLRSLAKRREGRIGGEASRPLTTGVADAVE